MNLKRMILHAMLPAMMLGVFSLLAAPASAASKKKLKAQPIRVACVGNSITYGTGIEDRARDSYPSQLQRMLGDKYVVGNFGKPGATLLYHGHRPYVVQKEFKEALAEMYGETCKIEKHTVIQVDVNPCGTAESLPIEGSPYALNDIAILKRDSASMITIRAYVNDDFLVTYQADGLIISTPTGSTAYSLSNGGPIIVPNSGSICLTPVAPHSLNIRPIVLNDTTVIRLAVESRSHNFLMAVDGRSEKLYEGTELIIRKAPYVVNVVKLRSKRYFALLREKLMWGADQRG